MEDDLATAADHADVRLKTGYHISGDSDPLASAAEAQQRHIERLEARNRQLRRRARAHFHCPTVHQIEARPE